MALVERVAPHVPDADPVVLANLMELSTHWLAAGRVGATLVWRTDGDPHELDELGMQASVPIPPLDLRRRAHFAALLNALSQYDRAALVDPARPGPHGRRAPPVVRAQPPRDPAPPRHAAHVGPALQRRLRHGDRVRRVLQRHALRLPPRERLLPPSRLAVGASVRLIAVTGLLSA